MFCGLLFAESVKFQVGPGFELDYMKFCVWILPGFKINV